MARAIYPVAALAMLLPWCTSAFALLIGVALALLLQNPYLELTRKYTSTLLGIAVTGLGAGMNLEIIGKVGLMGIGYTVSGIAMAFLIGSLIGRCLRTPRDTSLLITVGTAICGGSAIAAVAPVIRAKPHEISVSLGIVFILNAVALFLFPPIGHFFGLSETQFGLWSALAIHDTSSVVGATLQYGAHALEIGTTVKLARALWIVPIVFAISLFRPQSHSDERDKKAVKKPWFILGFLIAAALVTYFPSLSGLGHQIETVAKRLMVLTLFLIGTNLNLATLKSVGAKPFVQGFLLWLIMGSTTLITVLRGWVHL